LSCCGGDGYHLAWRYAPNDAYLPGEPGTDRIYCCESVVGVRLRKKARRIATGPEADYEQLIELPREQLMEAQLRSLRAQISPPIIYNSLNASAGLIPTDPVGARELLVDFADFTRYSLGTEGDFTTLEDELAAVEHYVVLEKARFGQRLQVRDRKSVV